MLNFLNPYRYYVYSLAFAFLSYAVYNLFLAPRIELKDEKAKTEQLEANITLNTVNLPIKVDNALVITDANKTNKAIKELQNEENTIEPNDINYSNILNGMFFFKPQRKD
jgi:hypothetical protein